jgi:HEAT repeat protein
MKADLLKDLAQSFAAKRATVSKTIRELYEANPDAFIEDAIQVLRDAEDSPGTRFILAVLSPRHDFLRFLSDPASFTAAQSAGLIRQLKSQDARLEWKVANMVAHLDYADDKTAAYAAHCLEILGLLSEDPTALPALRALINCPSARVRSKAALIIGHISRNPQWAKLTDLNQDARVVANAVESIWGLDKLAAKEVFRDAVASRFHRSAVNGAVGLYLARESEAVTWLYSFARHEQRDFRAAAAWGMGRTADPRFVKALETLLKDPDEKVRTAAAQATGVLAQRLAALKELPEIPLQVTAEFQNGKHTVHVTSEEQSKLPPLDALHFCLVNGTTPVEEYSFAKLHGAEGYAYELHFPGPRTFSRLVNVEVFTDRVCAHGSALETGEEEVKPLAEILRKLH